MFKSLLPYIQQVLFDFRFARIPTLLVASPPGFMNYIIEQHFRDDMFSIGRSRARPVSELLSGEAAIALYTLKHICLLPSPFKKAADVQTVLILELLESELAVSILAIQDTDAIHYNGMIPSKRIRLSFPAAAWHDKTCDTECIIRTTEVLRRTESFIRKAGLFDIDAIILRNCASAAGTSLEHQLTQLLKELDGQTRPVLRSTHPFAASRAMAARHQRRREKEIDWDTWKIYLQMEEVARQDWERHERDRQERYPQQPDPKLTLDQY